ncbi:hypothetical protein, partial [Tolypothrix sp. VBCCA 56010]|uniref:hypothetical protein n=1 Tax=Tolypothrix sp. VBCCA 56010 TaxID=3137731 RepID=UPI003D7DA511
FAQIFGEGAYQTPQMLVIPKAGLGYSGNSPQALLVALLERVRQYFNGYLLTETGDFINVNGEALEFYNSLHWECLNVLLTRTQTQTRDGVAYYNYIFKIKIILLNDGNGIIASLNINDLDGN